MILPDRRSQRLNQPRTAHPNAPPHPLRNAVAKSAPEKKHLRLYTEQPPKPLRPPIEAVACLPELLRAFQTATGWPLQYNGKGGAAKGIGEGWSL